MTNTSSTESLEQLAQSPLALTALCVVLLACGVGTCWGFRAFVGRVAAVCAGILVVMSCLTAILEDLLGLGLILLTLSLMVLAAPWLGEGRAAMTGETRTLRGSRARVRLLTVRRRDIATATAVREASQAGATVADHDKAAVEPPRGLVEGAASEAERELEDRPWGDRIAHPSEWDGSDDFKGRKKL